MKHLGDITKIDWTQVEPVDVVTGGSPCQDLSVAGARAGLDGARSGLFFEQIRCIKEMRENAKRATGVPRPRFCVWENVKGAYSSNGGKDFQSVLTEFVRVVREDAPDVPLPPGGRWPHSGCLMGRGADGEPFSIAWRLHDAQFWGVAQRRQRVSVVADFGGTAAPEVSFVRQGLQGHPDASGAQREGAADGASPRAGAAISFQERAGKPGGGKGILIQPEHVGALSTLNNQSVCADASQYYGYRMNCNTGPLTAGNLDHVRGDTPLVFDARGNGDGRCANTITGDHENSITDYSAIAVQAYSIGAYTSEGMKSENPHSGIHVADQARTLDASGNDPSCWQGGICVLEGNGYRPSHHGDGYAESETSFTLNGTEQHGVAYGIGRDAFNQGKNAHFKPSIDEELQPSMTARGPGAVCAADGTQTSPTLTSNNAGGNQRMPDKGNFNCVIADYIVRRLTPKECERLQGFPDDWTNLGEWTDSKGKRHKDADSPRYKALGNSIALPYWYWLLRRIAAQYDGPATLGSLFDGIGGFPLCWERVNGKGSARWASEIEEFPMAVTKYRFGEN